MSQHCYIASFPRSGNTFFRHMMREMYGLKTYSIYDEPDAFYGGRMDRADKSQPVTFIKTHSVVKAFNLGIPAVYIVRDGRDAAVSLAHYHRTAKGDERPVEELMKMIVEGRMPAYDETEYWFDWTKHVRAWTRRVGPTALVKFEDLIERPLTLIPKVIEALGLGIEPTNVRADLFDFDAMHEMDPNIFRRGVVGSYKDEMPEDIQETFWEIHGDMMTEMGYEREEVCV